MMIADPSIKDPARVPAVEWVVSEAMKLSEPERQRVVAALEATLDEVTPDADWEAAWVEEAERRFDAYQRGEVEAVDVEEVFPGFYPRCEK